MGDANTVPSDPGTLLVSDGRLPVYTRVLGIGRVAKAGSTGNVTKPHPKGRVTGR
jgi:hypothetical protein